MNRGIGIGISVIGTLVLLGYLAYRFLIVPVPVACNLQVPQPRVLAFGDSLVAGYGATTDGGFVTLVSRTLNVPIVNQGRSGDTTESAQLRLDAALSLKPDITLILLGGNDALRQVPVPEVEENLKETVEAFVESGSQVVLLGVLGGIGFSGPYESMFERLAELPGVTYVPNILSGIITDRSLMSDAIHPNEEGYQRIAERVAPVVEKVCGGE